MNKNKVNKIDSKNKKLFKLSKKNNIKLVNNIHQNKLTNDKIKSNIKVTF